MHRGLFYTIVLWKAGGRENCTFLAFKCFFLDSYSFYLNIQAHSLAEILPASVLKLNNF